MSSPSDDALSELATKQHGIFSARQIADLGYTHAARQARLTAGRWELLYDGVYRIGGAPRTWRGDLLAACLASPEPAAASHRSAAALEELPAGRTDSIEIMCKRWRRTRHGGLVVHESLVIEDEDLASVDGIPCTSTARTLFDLARKLSPTMLDANIDAALRRGLVTVDELRRTSTRLATKGRPGGLKFRTSVSARTRTTVLPESVPERVLADLLVRQGLPAPLHQFVVRDDAGAFVARVDLAYPEWRIVIEYDSVEHHTGTAAHIRDSKRRDAIGDLGYSVITATSADLKDRGGRVAASVRRRRP
jgi:very-short-patch-repair endonuclease